MLASPPKPPLDTLPAGEAGHDPATWLEVLEAHDGLEHGQAEAEEEAARVGARLDRPPPTDWLLPYLASLAEAGPPPPADLSRPARPLPPESATVKCWGLVPRVCHGRATAPLLTAALAGDAAGRRPLCSMAGVLDRQAELSWRRQQAPPQEAVDTQLLVLLAATTTLQLAATGHATQLDASIQRVIRWQRGPERAQRGAGADGGVGVAAAAASNCLWVIVEALPAAAALVADEADGQANLERRSMFLTSGADFMASLGELCAAATMRARQLGCMPRRAGLATET